MDNITTLKGLIIGMEKMGAAHVKTDEAFVYFDIPIGSEIDDQQKLQRAKSAFRDLLALGVKVRRVNVSNK